MDIYKDIASRTNGEIYIGVVGPVRTGKSTFIKRFMDLCVLPYMEDGHLKERTIDELPQSSQGKTIMTTEPKFIPQNGVDIRMDGTTEVRVRLVDCVGFVVDGANGHMENGQQRMVKTPWFGEEIPFEDAAQIGTLKVIKEHATIGVVVTTDGSFGEIDRKNYIDAEERTIHEMEETGKPYVIILNCERPYSIETQELRDEMEAKYGRPVLALNCKQMQKSDIVKLLENVLLEFPISVVKFYIPKWTEMLEKDHPVKAELIRFASEWIQKRSRMRDLYDEEEIDDLQETSDEGSICKPYIQKIHTANGTVELRLDVDEEHYYTYLSDITGTEISSQYQLIGMLRELSGKKESYEKVEDAMDSVVARGYGVVAPALSDIVMEEPELITHAGKYGVKIRANSPSIHMIRANIETEIAPIVGNKEQAEDLITYIKEGELSADGVWSTNIFGKSLGEMMEDGIRDKLEKMDDECQTQLQNTMQKIVNDNNGGLVCIII
ncbi:MAG: stage IV sporulation protein A [Agathobacter sp.]|nr:stage IV sporulation protein A [Agathobacter sp.]